MNIICKLFDRSETDNIARILGNMMISGVDNFGRKAACNDLIKYNLLRNRTTLIFQGMATADSHSQLKEIITPYGKKVYDVALAPSYGKEIDILSAFSSVDDKASFIVTLLDYLNTVSDTVKLRAQRFYYYAIEHFDSTSTPYNLERLASLDLDELIELIGASSLSEAEKNKRLRFLNDATTASAFLDIESYMLQLNSFGICRALSGSVSCAEAFSGGNVTIFTGFAGEDAKKRELFIKSVIYATKFCLESLATSGPISILLDGTDFMQDEVARSLMEYNATKDVAVYILMDDISTYIAKNGNELIEKTKAFLVFTQGSDQNASFWSDFFGSMDVQERSYSYTKRRGLFSSGTWSSGGVVPGPGKYNTATTNVYKVNKPIFAPDVFRGLSPTDVMCYLREPLIRRKSRIE